MSLYEYKTIMRRLAYKFFKNIRKTFFGLKVEMLRTLKGFIEVGCSYIYKKSVSDHQAFNGF